MYLRIEKIEDKGVVCQCRPGPRAISNARRERKIQQTRKRLPSYPSTIHRVDSIRFLLPVNREARKDALGTFELGAKRESAMTRFFYRKNNNRVRVDRSFRPNRIIKSFHQDCVWNTSFICQDVDWFFKCVFLEENGREMMQ